MTDTSDTPQLTGLTLAELFQLYRAILAELRRRKVVRTENAPAGDYAEYLVAAAFGGRLAANSEKSYDVLSVDGERLQVKARVVSAPPKAAQLQLSPFRSFDFDSAVIILLSSVDYALWKAAKIPAAVVQAAGVHSNHVNGTIVFARADLMDHAEAVDITEAIRAVQTTSIPEPVISDEKMSDPGTHVQRTPSRSGKTVQIGYTNRNRQTVIEATGLPGTDHGQSVYVLRCGECGNEYGSNGSDNHQRRCPNCQGGRPDLKHQ